MSVLLKLRAAVCLEDVASILGYKASALAYIIYKIPDASKYTTFQIPKRDGNFRQIDAPNPRLKLLQKRLADLLYGCLAEYRANNPSKTSLAHGFEYGRSIVTNADLHRRRRYVLNLDLDQFFPSINFGRVRGTLIKDQRFLLSEKVATIISQIACHNNGLPQGSPCSPIISNIVANILDARLVRLAKLHKCTYSRYVDDITFSTSQKIFPTDLAFLSANDPPRWELGAQLISKIQQTGFDINNRKTRMQFRGSRQIVTGLVVNEKVNIRREYYRTIRTMCHTLFKTGECFRSGVSTNAGALHPGAQRTLVKMSELEGALGHIYYVKTNRMLQKKTKPPIKTLAPKAVKELHKNFLYYKNFVVLDKPLIIPEGITDIIYLRAAIKKLSQQHPKLGHFVGSNFNPSLKFLQSASIGREIMDIVEGSSNFPRLIKDYARLIKKYTHAPLNFPVILLIDNDEGSREIFSAIKSVTCKNISYDTTDAYYYVTQNLYVVKMPELGTGRQSCIENLFDPSLLDVVIDGKVFDSRKKHKEPGKYGKKIFAEKVIKPNVDTIDFSNFSALLARLEKVLDDYKIVREGRRP